MLVALQALVFAEGAGAKAHGLRLEAVTEEASRLPAAVLCRMRFSARAIALLRRLALGCGVMRRASPAFCTYAVQPRRQQEQW